MLTSARYSQVIQENIDKEWSLPVSPLEVGLLHGAIRLMLIHPEVEEKYSTDFKIIAGEIRTWCLDRYREMGFTEAELQELDSEFPD